MLSKDKLEKKRKRTKCFVIESFYFFGDNNNPPYKKSTSSKDDILHSQAFEGSIFFAHPILFSLINLDIPLLAKVAFCIFFSFFIINVTPHNLENNCIIFFLNIVCFFLDKIDRKRMKNLHRKCDKVTNNELIDELK